MEGHGTHTAGSALGSTLNTPAETPTTCGGSEVPGCVGGCIDVDDSSWGDDLLTLPAGYSPFGVDIDRLCPMVDCDEETDQRCLTDNVGQTLADHGGMAQGAKLAFFDVFAGNFSFRSHAGNGLWEPCLVAGCKIHSVSIGASVECEVQKLDILYDDFMYNVSCIDDTEPTMAIHSDRFLHLSALRWTNYHILEAAICVNPGSI